MQKNHRKQAGEPQ